MNVLGMTVFSQTSGKDFSMFILRSQTKRATIMGLVIPTLVDDWYKFLKTSQLFNHGGRSRVILGERCKNKNNKKTPILQSHVTNIRTEGLCTLEKLMTKGK